MNTEQLKKIEEVKKDIIKVLDHYNTYKSRITDSIVVDLFNAVLPHLISSDEIKREVAEDILNKLADVGVAFNKSSSFEYNNGFEDGLLEMDLAVATVEAYIKKTYLTQSKEGGE